MAEEAEHAEKFFLVLNLPPTVFPVRGKYTLKLSVDGAAAGTLPLYVMQADPGAESGAGITIEQSPITIDPAQAWFWTPEWQAGEQLASAELAAGETDVFSTAEDFLADLDR